MGKKREIVPVVVYHKETNSGIGFYNYQVFTAEYCRSKHTILNVSKDYECFHTEEEVSAYTKGLEVAGALYGDKI